MTGELVATGQARFGAQDEDIAKSPYVDVKTNDGKVHRLWGVSLPGALSKAGASRGDTVFLRKDGVETVMVKTAVVDGESGKSGLRNAQSNAMSGRQNWLKPRTCVGSGLQVKATGRHCSGNWPTALLAQAPKPPRSILGARLAIRPMLMTLPAGVVSAHLPKLQPASRRGNPSTGVVCAKAPTGRKTVGAGRRGARFCHRAGTKHFLS